jgi:hydrogenase nickel incorporation protein HypA/HybF
MHEFAIASAIVATAVRHADGRPVAVVTVRCGRLRQVVPASLAFAFGVLSRETLCDGAVLEQEVVPARLRCDACARDWEIELPIFRCPTCGTAAVEVVAGEELEVESIEIGQDEEAPCTA